MLRQETRDCISWEVVNLPSLLLVKELLTREIMTIVAKMIRMNFVCWRVILLKEVLFVECEKDEDYEKFSFYILDHRKELHPEFTTPMTFFFLGTQSFYGGCLLAKDLNQRVIGALGYVYGTPEGEFKDPHILRINMVHIAEPYRGSLLFYNGLKHLIHKLDTEAKGINEVQFFIPKENNYLNRLCLKFSKKVKETSSLGTEILYSAHFTELCSYIEKGSRHVEMVGDSQN